MNWHKMGVLSLAVVVVPAISGQTKRPRSVGPAVRGPVRRAPALGPGAHARVNVLAPTRFDWGFAVSVALGSTAWPRAMPGYLPAQTAYQLYVPPTAAPRAGQPLVLFLPPDNEVNDLKNWEMICRKYGALFVSPQAAGKDVPEARRVRMALDVLDDVRRRWNIDSDRCYLVGAGVGARTACAVAFAYPEAFGGVVAVGAGSSLPWEPDRRVRIKERLSVALLTGEKAPGQPELERYVVGMLRECGVGMRYSTDPGAEETNAGAMRLEEAFVWVESLVAQRRAMAVAFPASRLASGAAPSAEEWAQALVQEGTGRLLFEATRTAGIMQLHAVRTRWATTAAARDAERQLEAHNARARVSWQEALRVEQQTFAYRRARAYAMYLAAAVAERPAGQRGPLIRAAIEHWSLVLEQDKDTRMGQEAKAHIERLRQALAKVGG
jgi:hypothetical protein